MDRRDFLYWLFSVNIAQLCVGGTIAKSILTVPTDEIKIKQELNRSPDSLDYGDGRKLNVIREWKGKVELSRSPINHEEFLRVWSKADFPKVDQGWKRLFTHYEISPDALTLRWEAKDYQEIV